jgi:hypothetical protein
VVRASSGTVKALNQESIANEHLKGPVVHGKFHRHLMYSACHFGIIAHVHMV